MPVTGIKSKWSSGSLIFYQDPRTFSDGMGVQLGEDGSGLDVKFFGDTSGAYMLWDQSADALVFAGGAAPKLAANDGAALGSATLSWSDLFLASGGVINWNNGDVTLTHASNLLTFAGGVFSVGTFASATAGSGIALGTLTKALDVCADDGAAALTAGSYQAVRARMLVASAIASGDISVGGLTGQTKVVANVASTGYICGVRGYVECSSASISTAAGVRGMIDVPAGSTIASGAIVAAFQADSNDLGGTHTGKAAVLHVPNPVAGTWDFFAVFGSATGAIATQAGGSLTITKKIPIRDDAGNTIYIAAGTIA